MRRDEIQNLLKSQSFATVKPSAFKQVGDPIFPDQAATDGMATVREVVDTFRAIHTPSYGGIIPQTGKTYATTGDSGLLLQLTGNEVARIFLVQVGSTTLPETVSLLVDGQVYVLGTTDPTTSINIMQNVQPLFLDSTQALTYSAVSATQTVSIVYHLVSQ